jgi:L-threonylcarbamoyladenylate synthase
LIQTEIAKVDSYHPNKEIIANAVAVLNKSGIICFPTETVYGLGAKIFDEKALEKLFTIKGRDKRNPFSIFIKEIDELEAFAEEVSPSARKLIDRFWPGPLTLVFKSRLKNPSPYLLKHNKIGIRISSHPLVQELVKQLNCPITATSANLSGKKPCRSSKEVEKVFWGKIDLLLDGGRTKKSEVSTVLDVSEEKWSLIREGSISLTKIREVLAIYE